MEEWIIYRVLQIIAAFSGAKGGTINTTGYANKNGIIVKNILT